jgi:hypothetical protein
VARDRGEPGREPPAAVEPARDGSRVKGAAGAGLRAKGEQFLHARRIDRAGGEPTEWCEQTAEPGPLAVAARDVVGEGGGEVSQAQTALVDAAAARRIPVDAADARVRAQEVPGGAKDAAFAGNRREGEGAAAGGADHEQGEAGVGPER